MRGTRRRSTLLYEQACISRSARGAVWGVLTCLFAHGGIKGPKIFFACGAPRIPLEISKETVFSLQCFSFGPGAVLGGAYMLVRGHACSRKGVEQVPVEELYPHDLGGEDRQQLSQIQGACDVLAEDTACLLAATMAGMMRDPC